jgi:hypothetical protein
LQLKIKILAVAPTLSLAKRLSLFLVIALMVLLTAGPFLHAHYGVAKVTGLHLAGVSTVEKVHGVFSVTSFTQEEEQESAAVGVGTSYTRQIAVELDDQPMRCLLVMAVLFASLAVVVAKVIFTSRYSNSELRAFSPGFPPLPHAPPLSHL